MNKEDLEKITNMMSKKVARSITMKQEYFDKILNDTLVLRDDIVSEHGIVQQFDALPVYIDNDIKTDFELNY